MSKFGIFACALLLSVSAAHAQQNGWIGRWHIPENAAACNGKAGESDGLLVYTATEMFGIENRCRILSMARKGAKTELKMRCRGEGSPSNDTELLEVVGGKLQRTVRINGKTETFTYSRCP